MYKKLFLIFFWLFTVVWISLWALLLKWLWSNSIWLLNSKITSSEFSFTPKSYSQYSNEYKNENKRLYFDSAVFKSEVYWDFEMYGKVDLVKNTNVNSKCEWENISYKFVWDSINWNFSNSDWWKWFKVLSDINYNYYCPNSWIFSIPIGSKENPIFFETFVIKYSPEQNLTVNVVWSNWNNVTLDDRVIYSSLKLAISGIVNKANEVSDEFRGWTSTQNMNNNINFIDYNSSLDIWVVWNIISRIKKNIQIQTKWLTWNTNNSNISSISKTMLYDFRWKTATYKSNVDNLWKILTINNNWSWLEVKWDQMIVVKWWNIYIKDDIYNKDNSSILTIIALRDEKNISNGWNIYIDPKVTNIDAIIVWEWSILSFDWDKVINSSENNNVNILRNQLLIYWSVFTRNTIWKNISIYNTDDYIRDKSSTNTNKYNLENLRSFQVIRSEQVAWDCNYDWKIVAMWNNEDTALKYAFAWKKECFLDDSTRNNLRPTYRTASTVIEHNPNLQIISPKILGTN